jgi:predicted GTPase
MVSGVPGDLDAALGAVGGLLEADVLDAWPTRDDDLAALAATRSRLERRYALAVVGEFSSGKSYLLNALIGKTRYDAGGRVVGLLATDINPSTATITELEYGSPEVAHARYDTGRVERIAMDTLSRFVAVGKDGRGALHDATADTAVVDDTAPSFVTVALESAFLQAGFTIADTPGLASLNPAHRRATLGYLPRTDAVLYLIDTQQPFTEGDAAFLGLIGEHVRTIFIVQTKIDLWRMHESDGREAWAAARARIAERAARFAPGAEVYSVSAYEYARGVLDDDAALRDASGFPELIAGLERSLDARVRSARVARARDVLAALLAKTAARMRRDAALAEADLAVLQAERTRTASELDERERALGRERDEVARAGDERRAWIAQRGETLASAATKALASAIDVADIERVRDRGRFHSLVDATVAPIWTAFARDVGSDVARALAKSEGGRADLRVADLAALRLGGEPGAGAWSRDLASGIASTIVLGAVGGPTVDFVHRVGAAFSARPHGTYMKRELGAELNAQIFPAFEADIEAFARDMAGRIGGIYDDVAAAIERDRSTARAQALDPIERAIAHAGDPAARTAAAQRLAAASAQLALAEAAVARISAPADGSGDGVHRDEDAAVASAMSGDGGARGASFDAAAYEAGLRPERYRVVLLGALRRGKSSLINAIAGTRILQDEGGRESRFPIHVRFGERERAYELASGGTWSEIETREAMSAAARAPVLIETPWSMPRQLVLVHAPAFDSGDPDAEAIALAAAGAASEIVALFSRQLSDRELALYTRVASANVPFAFAHTIADNETSNERRTVVNLAERYARERGIAVTRVFTISALDYFEAAQARRAPSGWNELGALRDTLAAHAEEHMHKRAERERLARANASVVTKDVVPEEAGFGKKLARFFRR